MAEPVALTKQDALAGLPGYNSFLSDIAVRTQRAQTSNGNVSIALVDIDQFGALNEAYGSEAGDEIIALLSRALVSVVGEHNTVYRYGGDAFMILFSDTEKEQAFLKTEEARKALERSHAIRSGDSTIILDIAVSCGVASYPDDATSESVLLRKCHEALYRAKVSGRNKVCIAREEKMVTKTVHYTQGQLEGLTRLANREGINEASLLREGLDDLLRKHNS